MADAPYSLETEQALLGSLMYYPETVVNAFDSGLAVDDFYVPSHKKIYQVILALDNDGIVVDVTNVITRLNDTGELKNVGGANYIMKLSDMAVSDANSEYYIKTVQDKSTLRKLIRIAQEISEDASSNSHEANEVLSEAEHKILDVTRNVKTKDFSDSGEVMKKVLEDIKNLQERKEMSGVGSGFDDLDRITNGFQPNNLIILAARPSVGKTAFALNIAANAAIKYQKHVAFFSLEMTVEDLCKRILSKEAMVDGNKITKGYKMTNDDWASIKFASDAITKANLYFDDSSSIKVNDIFAKCRKLKQENRLDMIIVDYLQLITPSSRSSDNRQQEVAEISRSLKTLAREMGVPVIALSQLSRDIEKRSGEKRPVLSDLRESGGIEQDADIVMFLHRPDYYNKDKEAGDVKTVDASFEAELIISKHRNGSTGDVKLVFQPNISKFYPKERDE